MSLATDKTNDVRFEGRSFRDNGCAYNQRTVRRRVRRLFLGGCSLYEERSTKTLEGIRCENIVLSVRSASESFTISLSPQKGAWAASVRSHRLTVKEASHEPPEYGWRSDRGVWEVKQRMFALWVYQYRVPVVASSSVRKAAISHVPQTYDPPHLVNSFIHLVTQQP